jgi:hypothetical protein
MIVCISAWARRAMAGVAGILIGGWLAPIDHVAFAQPESIAVGHGFKSRCAGATEWQYIACLSYVAGLHDMASYLGPNATTGRVCAPPGMTIVDWHRLLLAYLDDRPERGDALTVALLWEAAVRAFPCRQS